MVGSAPAALESNKKPRSSWRYIPTDNEYILKNKVHVRTVIKVLLSKWSKVDSPGGRWETTLDKAVGEDFSKWWHLPRAWMAGRSQCRSGRIIPRLREERAGKPEAGGALGQGETAGDERSEEQGRGLMLWRMASCSKEKNKEPLE